MAAQQAKIHSEPTGSAPDSPPSSPKVTPGSPHSDETDDPTDGDRVDAGPSRPSNGRRRSTRVSANDSGSEKREKRKRSRVTPEQLMQLETLFAANRSPTAARRKEISEILGMAERQTQIWFQNRRAKAKLQAGTKSCPSTDPLTDLPSLLDITDDHELRARIHEDGPVTIISCTDLAIGSWRRIATLEAKYDLLTYVSEARRCLTWYVYCAGSGFKMELPLEAIANVSMTNISPGMAMVRLTLSRPPAFFLEARASMGADMASARYWRPCSDWTEDMQASRVLQHELIGAAAQLSQDLMERYLSGRPATQNFARRGFTHGDTLPSFDMGRSIHAPAPLANQTGMLHPPRIDYHGSQLQVPLHRRASDPSSSPHPPSSSASWDSPTTQSAPLQYLPPRPNPPAWAESYSLSSYPKPIVPYNVQSTDPMRLPSIASMTASMPAVVSGYFAEVSGPSRRSSESSHISSSSGPSSTSTGFDPASPPTSDMAGSPHIWGDPPPFAEPQPLYEAPDYDYIPDIHLGTHVGMDIPSYKFSAGMPMSEKHYG